MNDLILAFGDKLSELGDTKLDIGLFNQFNNLPFDFVFFYDHPTRHIPWFVAFHSYKIKMTPVSLVRCSEPFIKPAPLIEYIELQTVNESDQLMPESILYAREWMADITDYLSGVFGAPKKHSLPATFIMKDKTDPDNIQIYEANFSDILPRNSELTIYTDNSQPIQHTLRLSPMYGCDIECKPVRRPLLGDTKLLNDDNTIEGKAE